MLERFVSIENAAKELDDIDPIRLADSDRIKEVLPTLENFKSIMTDLQKQGQHIVVVHETFQMIVEDFLEFSDYLAADAEILHNPLFEKACVKIISGRQESLTDGEKAQVSHFLRQPEPQEPALERSTGSKHSYTSLLRDRKRQRLTTSEDYVIYVSSPAPLRLRNGYSVTQSTSSGRQENV
ncbi:hypothetical protein F444_14027 [Phytophthora nicotianae P1976]|uniref:Uncharacterized protein n=1 Tax=Phytophthora nicotianae P1976 TaxID=1317066 RepID=A0A080ZRW9_PHYNI|nr:hypothetical protein F444_14027 [Phytophthora nicotianae P1976]